MRYHLAPTGMPIIKKKKKMENTNAGKDVGKLGLSYIAGENVKWHSGKQFGSFSTS